MSDLIERLRGMKARQAVVVLVAENVAQQAEIARLRDGIYRAAEGLDGGADVNIITQLLDSLLGQKP